MELNLHCIPLIHWMTVTMQLFPVWKRCGVVVLPERPDEDCRQQELRWKVRCHVALRGDWLNSLVWWYHNNKKTTHLKFLDYFTTTTPFIIKSWWRQQLKTFWWRNRPINTQRFCQCFWWSVPTACTFLVVHSSSRLLWYCSNNITALSVLLLELGTCQGSVSSVSHQNTDKSAQNTHSFEVHWPSKSRRGAVDPYGFHFGYSLLASLFCICFCLFPPVQSSLRITNHSFIFFLPNQNTIWIKHKSKRLQNQD